MIRELLLLEKMSLEDIAIPNTDLHVCLTPCTRAGPLFRVGWQLLLSRATLPLTGGLRAYNDLILCLSAFISPVF